MAILPEVLDQLALKFEVVFAALNERQRRSLLAAEARLLGHGGVRAVARVTGVSESTVRKGCVELRGRREGAAGRAGAREGRGRKVPRSRTRGCCRRFWRWSIRMSGVIRSRRCGG